MSTDYAFFYDMIHAFRDHYNSWRGCSIMGTHVKGDFLNHGSFGIIVKITQDPEQEWMDERWKKVLKFHLDELCCNASTNCHEAKMLAEFTALRLLRNASPFINQMEGLGDIVLTGCGIQHRRRCVGIMMDEHMCTLQEYRETFDPQFPKKVAMVMAELYSGLWYMHKAGVCHTELDEHKVMVSFRGHMKIIGFTGAYFRIGGRGKPKRQLDPDLNQSPQNLDNRLAMSLEWTRTTTSRGMFQVAVAKDYLALGHIGFYLAFGYCLLPPPEHQRVELIKKLRWVEKDLTDLLINLTEPNHQRRIKAKEIIEHPTFKDIPHLIDELPGMEHEVLGPLSNYCSGTIRTEEPTVMRCVDGEHLPRPYLPVPAPAVFELETDEEMEDSDLEVNYSSGEYDTAYESGDDNELFSWRSVSPTPLVNFPEEGTNPDPRIQENLIHMDGCPMEDFEFMWGAEEPNYDTESSEDEGEKEKEKEKENTDDADDEEEMCTYPCQNCYGECLFSEIVPRPVEYFPEMHDRENWDTSNESDQESIPSNQSEDYGWTYPGGKEDREAQMELVRIGFMDKKDLRLCLPGIIITSPDGDEKVFLPYGLPRPPRGVKRRLGPDDARQQRVKALLVARFLPSSSF